MFLVGFQHADFMAAKTIAEFPCFRSHHDHSSGEHSISRLCSSGWHCIKAIWKNWIAQNLPSSHQKLTIGGDGCSFQASELGLSCSLSDSAGLTFHRSFPAFVEPLRPHIPQDCVSPLARSITLFNSTPEQHERNQILAASAAHQ
jgi:hypothetical protein